MKYFNRKPTVGSRLIEATEQIVSDEQHLQSLIDNHKVMKKDKLGRIFSPLTGSRIRDLVQKTKESNATLY